MRLSFSAVRREESESRITASVVTSRAVVGSSRIITSGRQSTAMAMQIRCWMPPLIWWG